MHAGGLGPRPHWATKLGRRVCYTTSYCVLVRVGDPPETDRINLFLPWVLESVGHTHEHVPRRPRRPRTSRHPTGRLQCETCGRACLGKKPLAATSGLALAVVATNYSRLLL